jgi:hypothetical protein
MVSSHREIVARRAKVWAGAQTWAPIGHFREAAGTILLCASFAVLGGLCVEESGAGRGTDAASFPGTRARQHRFFNAKATGNHEERTKRVEGLGRGAPGDPRPLSISFALETKFSSAGRAT